MWIDMHASHEIVSSETAFETRVERGGRGTSLQTRFDERATLPSRGPFNGISVCSFSKREILNFGTKKFVYPWRVVFLEAAGTTTTTRDAVAPLLKDPI